MPMTGTDNTTGFARDVLAATALVLDALAVVGNQRRGKLTQAQTRLYDAAAGAYGSEELALASALVEVIKGYERTGSDR